MLDRYVEFVMLYVHFKEQPLMSIRTKTWEVRYLNLAKEPLEFKQIEMGSKIRLSVIIFSRPFSIFSALEFLQL